MPVRTPLVLKIAAVVNAVGLVVGLISYQSGLFFPATVVTQEDLDAEIDARRANALQYSPTAAHNPAKVAQTDAVLNGNQLMEIAKATGNSDSSSAAVDSIIPAGFVIANGPTVDYEAIRRRPEPASQELLLHDSVNLMWSSSKSTVIEPRTPEEKQKAIDRYIFSATNSFSDLDRNRDGQLTESETGEFCWKHFKQQGVVSDEALSFEGFLKNYVWYRSHYNRIHGVK